MGAPLAARPLVASGALAAIRAAGARGDVAGSFACLDVGCPVLTEFVGKSRDQIDQRIGVRGASQV